jgi:hypothetical protein
MLREVIKRMHYPLEGLGPDCVEPFDGADEGRIAVYANPSENRRPRRQTPAPKHAPRYRFDEPPSP